MMKKTSVYKYLLSVILSFAFSSLQAKEFTVTCNGEFIPVEEQNDVPLSYQLSTYKYARLTYDGQPLTVSITAGFPTENNNWDIAPYSYQLQGTLTENTLTFTVDRLGYVVVRFSKDQDFTKRIVLLIEEPEKLPEKEIVNIVTRYKVDNTGTNNETTRIQQALDEISGSNKTLYFPEGVYKTSSLQIRSNSSVHLSKESRLLADTSGIEPYLNNDSTGTNRFIYIKDAENIHITGLGAFDGNGTYFRGVFDPNGSQGKGGMRVLFIVNSRNIHFEGILLKDAARWNTQMVGCQDITFKYCKMLNNPNPSIHLTNFDGWDPDASQRILIENCFGWAGDDNIAIKCVGTGNPKIIQDVEDITVRSCVFLTKKSALKVGTETRCNQMKRIIFEDNDVIEADRVIAIEVLDDAIVDGVIYRNNRSDYFYPDAQKRKIYFNLKKRSSEQSNVGQIRNVMIEDCTFHSSFPNKIQIFRDEISTRSDDLEVTIRNLNINGKKIEQLTPVYFDIARCNGVINIE